MKSLPGPSEEKQFFIIPDVVEFDERLKPAEYRIYAHLSCCILKGTEPSITTIAKTCIMSEYVVRKSLDRLNELGWLSHFQNLDLVKKGWR
jgi:hypothetical protein